MVLHLTSPLHCLSSISRAGWVLQSGSPEMPQTYLSPQRFHSLTLPNTTPLLFNLSLHSIYKENLPFTSYGLFSSPLSMSQAPISHPPVWTEWTRCTQAGCHVTLFAKKYVYLTKQASCIPTSVPKIAYFPISLRDIKHKSTLGTKVEHF